METCGENADFVLEMRVFFFVWVGTVGIFSLVSLFHKVIMSDVEEKRHAFEKIDKLYFGSKRSRSVYLIRHLKTAAFFFLFVFNDGKIMLKTPFKHL